MTERTQHAAIEPVTTEHRQALCYTAYGLRIRSELPLKGLDRAPEGPVDVTIRLRATGHTAPELTEHDTYEFSEDSQFLCWPIVGAFLITGAHTIDIEPIPGVNEDWLAFPLLGPVFSVLLHKRGLLVLHASAVNVGGHGVVFAGDKLAGKSTTAAAFVRAGHPMLTDDVLAVTFDDHGGGLISPGFPQLKLMDDAGDAIKLADSHALPFVRPDFDKRQHLLDSGFSRTPVSPDRLLLLRRGTEAKLTRLSPTDALSAIMRFSYVTRFETRKIGAEGSHLKNCARLANLAQVCILEVPTGLEFINEVVRLVEADVAG